MTRADGESAAMSRADVRRAIAEVTWRSAKRVRVRGTLVLPLKRFHADLLKLTVGGRMARGLESLLSGYEADEPGQMRAALMELLVCVVLLERVS